MDKKPTHVIIPFELAEAIGNILSNLPAGQVAIPFLQLAEHVQKAFIEAQATDTSRLADSE